MASDSCLLGFSAKESVIGQSYLMVTLNGKLTQAKVYPIKECSQVTVKI